MRAPRTAIRATGTVSPCLKIGIHQVSITVNTLLRFWREEGIVLVYRHFDFWWFVCLNIEMISEFHNLRLIKNIATSLACTCTKVPFVQDFIAELALHEHHTMCYEEAALSSSSSLSVVFPLVSDCILPKVSIFSPMVVAFVAS